MWDLLTCLLPRVSSHERASAILGLLLPRLQSFCQAYSCGHANAESIRSGLPITATGGGPCLCQAAVLLLRALPSARDISVPINNPLPTSLGSRARILGRARDSGVSDSGRDLELEQRFGLTLLVRRSLRRLTFPWPEMILSAYMRQDIQLFIHRCLIAQVQLVVAKGKSAG